MFCNQHRSPWVTQTWWDPNSGQPFRSIIFQCFFIKFVTIWVHDFPPFQTDLGPQCLGFSSGLPYRVYLCKSITSASLSTLHFLVSIRHLVLLHIQSSSVTNVRTGLFHLRHSFTNLPIRSLSHSMVIFGRNLHEGFMLCFDGSFGCCFGFWSSVANIWFIIVSCPQLREIYPQ